MMAQRKHPLRNLAEPRRNLRACGTPIEKGKFRGTPAELPPSPLASGKLPNYLARLLQAGHLTPGLVQVIVEHDSWCAIFHGGTCNCDPTVTTRREGDAVH